MGATLRLEGTPKERQADQKRASTSPLADTTKMSRSSLERENATVPSGACEWRSGRLVSLAVSFSCDGLDCEEPSGSPVCGRPGIDTTLEVCHYI